MPAQVEIIDMLSDTAGIDRIGLLSPAVDFAMNFAGGKAVKKYRDGSSVQTVNVQISGKGTDQMAVASRLCEICDTLARKNVRAFPKTDEWEIRRVEVGTPPAPKGMSEGGVWFYACVISVNYYYKPRKD
ncbi:MAG: hypothetical protein NC395_11400 [Prevotella sp.]|nr:hypothetical protein [Prevotella sp.]